MFPFQPPPPTRFDLCFSIAGFPVRVHPLFWVVSILFGWSPHDPIGMLIWVIAVFTAILIHELGHAFAMRRFGQPSRIVLHFSGGLTISEPVLWGNQWTEIALTFYQRIFISLAGPGAGFILAAFILAITGIFGGSIFIFPILGFIPMPMASISNNNLLNTLIHQLLWINIFWGAINLMPVYPLDGGNVSRNLFVKSDPWSGVRKSLWLSVIAGGSIALIGLFIWNNVYIGVLFGFLAFQSYLSLQGGAG
jgi:stage IV sporulation protein FB